jgi:hypothetical protein
MLLAMLVIFLSAALSILLPVAIIAVRQTVKSQRQEVIRDLEAVFERPGEGERIIPSFEFVKFTYFLDQDSPPRGDRKRAAQDFSITVLVISSIPLMLLLFCLGVVAFAALLYLALEDLRPLPLVPNFIKSEPKTWLLVLMTAYLGSYLFVVRELLRAVANFEIGPTNLLAGAIHVLFGAITAVIIASVASEIFPAAGMTTTALIVAAFAVGFVPELGVRTLLRASQLWLFKREDSDVYKAFAATPVEVVDGIDTDVRARLAQYNITTVQHLATANPIMLFVETPYGVYQIIDWVAQAQLCSALGAKAVMEFWKIGIRTIFDLERGLLGYASTPELRHEIGKIIVAGRSAVEQARLGLGPESAPSDETDKTIIGLSAVLLDDLHIHRLRQICNRIAERLGSDNLRLRTFPTPAPGAAPEMKVAA